MWLIRFIFKLNGHDMDLPMACELLVYILYLPTFMTICTQVANLINLLYDIVLALHYNGHMPFVLINKEYINGTKSVSKDSSYYLRGELFYKLIKTRHLSMCYFQITCSRKTAPWSPITRLCSEVC